MGLCTCVRPLLGQLASPLFSSFDLLNHQLDDAASTGARIWRARSGAAAATRKNWPLWHGVSDGGDPWSLIGGR